MSTIDEAQGTSRTSDCLTSFVHICCFGLLALTSSCDSDETPINPLVLCQQDVACTSAASCPSLESDASGDATCVSAEVGDECHYCTDESTEIRSYDCTDLGGDVFEWRQRATPNNSCTPPPD